MKSYEIWKLILSGNPRLALVSAQAGLSLTLLKNNKDMFSHEQAQHIIFVADGC